MVYMAGRTKEILEHKPKEQHELRLRLMVPVQGELPLPIREAVETWRKVQAARLPLAAWFQEPYQEEFQAAVVTCLEEITALHEKECRPRGCTWNGKEVTFDG
jgi:hypothetical protein